MVRTEAFKSCSKVIGSLSIVIPGRCEALNPESRDSGSGANAPSRNDGSNYRLFRFRPLASGRGAFRHHRHRGIAQGGVVGAHLGAYRRHHPLPEPGPDATGVNSGAWLMPVLTPE